MLGDFLPPTPYGRWRHGAAEDFSSLCLSVSSVAGGFNFRCLPRVFNELANFTATLSRGSVSVQCVFHHLGFGIPSGALR